MEALRICRGCGVQAFTREDLEDFVKDNRIKYGRDNFCKSCENDRTMAKYYKDKEENPEYIRRRNVANNIRKAGINITVDAYLVMMEENKVCQKCKRKFKSANDKHLDHDHDTHLPRGILCMDCNTGIGKLGDNIEGLLEALDYLIKSQ